MHALEHFSASHATLLISALLEYFVALGWLLAATVLPRFRPACLHWSGCGVLLGTAFSVYLASDRWPNFPLYPLGNALVVGALVLQARGLQLAARQAPADGLLVALLALAVLVQVVWVAEHHTAWRIAGTSLLIAGLCAWNGGTLLRCLGQHSVRSVRRFGVLLGVPFVLGVVVFAVRMGAVLVAPEQLIRNGRLENSVSLLATLAWLFISLGMALALLCVVAYQLERQLSQAATHDALTGLPNRRAADEFLAQEALRAQRHGAPLSVLMIDIDFFKKVNDQHGHAGGDHVLRALAQLLKHRARASDLVARWGGEEFLMLLPDTPAEGARDMAEQLRLAVQNTPCQWQQHDVPTTISVGTATWHGGPFQANVLIANADSALYHAKNTGRNRVCMAGEVTTAC